MTLQFLEQKSCSSPDGSSHQESIYPTYFQKLILTKKLLGISLALVMLIGSVPLGFSEPLRVQLEQGIEIDQLQCNNPNHVLVLRTNGNVACVTERNAEKMNWMIVKTVESTDEISETLEATDEISKTAVLNVSSSIEFVDDGREIQRSLTQKAPAPSPVYDRIIASMDDGFSISETGVATFVQTPHEKYSVNPGVGFYAQDWIPDYIPQGQKLLFTMTSCYEKSGDCGIGLHFVPTTFVLHENATSHDLDVAKGFKIGIDHSVLPLDEVEDSIEYLKEMRESQPRNYGGFEEMTRDGKTVLAYEGGNALNHYIAVLTFHPDDHTLVSVSSNYHTLEEILPIFNSVMK